MKEQIQHSEKFLKQRKFMLVLPLLVVPFLTMIFWALGGGKVDAASVNKQAQPGFNMNLPDASLKNEKELDKMGVYARADRDSAKLKERIKTENRLLPGVGAGENEDAGEHVAHAKYKRFNYNPEPDASTQKSDENEERLMHKLELLNKQLSNPVEEPEAEPKHRSLEELGSMRTGDVDRLENMMRTMNQKDTSTDPELQQLNTVMEKMLDIQHPERVKEKLQQASEKNERMVFPVSAPEDERISILGNVAKQDTTTKYLQSTNSFYSLDEDIGQNISQNIVEAEVAETQTLVNGATVKLRLATDVYIKGILIPKETFIYGKASLNAERLHLVISSVQYMNKLLPVALTAYDLDGMAGIYIPGAITGDVARQSADQTVQELGITSLDPSIGAQAAGAGLQAAKNLFSKKVKQVKVLVKEGYKLLLRDSNNK